jgi:hypothetical protein
MKLRKTKVAIGLLVIIMTSVLFSNWRSRVVHRRELQEVSAAESADQKFIASLRTSLPMGTPLEQVRKELEDRKLNIPDYSDGQLLLERGTEPSQVWYCGPISRYVTLTFTPSLGAEPRLKSINRETRALNCL